jgi:hypothetical protein
LSEHRKRVETFDAHIARHGRVIAGDRVLERAEAEAVLRSMSSAGEARRKGGRPAHWNREQLAKVARIYLAAHRERKHPTKAVAEQLHLTPSGAAKVVRLARAAKPPLLPETTKGRATGWEEGEAAK